MNDYNMVVSYDGVDILIVSYKERRWRKILQPHLPK